MFSLSGKTYFLVQLPPQYESNLGKIILVELKLSRLP
jgi:hypothetical protein